MKHHLNSTIVLAAAACSCFSANAAGQTCEPPPGFVDTPHPAIAPISRLVSHTEQVVINRPFAVVSEVMNKPLEQNLRPTGSLPGVLGIHVLTPGGWGNPGSRRIVCLSDGSTTHEEVLEREGNWHTPGGGAKLSRFRYIVWDYTTPKGRSVAYGVGEFRTVQTAGRHTRVTWTYSFKLKENVFPGNLGALGRWLFRVEFLDRDYASMMRGVLSRHKVAAEQQPASNE